MAVTCREIMNLEICKRLKLLGGADGLDRIVSWPYIKNMDTISKWIHGQELIFVIGAKEDISEKGMLRLMDEAVMNDISGVVMLHGEDYITKVPKSIITYANQQKIPLFKMPFMLKLLDVTKEISKYIIRDREMNQQCGELAGTSMINILLKNKSREEILAYCFNKLQPLTEADKVLKTEYVKTLRCYLECNNDLLHASRHMYIHRNTMTNRMRKIAGLLEQNINDAAVRTELYNIFKVLEYYGMLS